MQRQNAKEAVVTRIFWHQLALCTDISSVLSTEPRKCLLSSIMQQLCFSVLWSQIFLDVRSLCSIKWLIPMINAPRLALQHTAGRCAAENTDAKKKRERERKWQSVEKWSLAERCSYPFGWKRGRTTTYQPCTNTSGSAGHKAFISISCGLYSLLQYKGGKANSRQTPALRLITAADRSDSCYQGESSNTESLLTDFPTLRKGEILLSYPSLQ